MSECHRRSVLSAFLCSWILMPLSGVADERAPKVPAPAPQPQTAAPVSKEPPGYLAPGSMPVSRDILPPPPAEGSPGEALDRAVFFATRKLKGTPRWELATRDALYGPAAFLSDFSCALGVRLDATNSPTLTRVLNRMRPDISGIVDSAKAHYKHPRPFVGTDQPICEEETREAAAKSWSYPSGHATVAWAFGLMLAELAPDMATPVLVRARVLGESRVVCGMHTVSDVEAGRTAGSVLMNALHTSPGFKADLERARGELAAARGAVPAAVPDAAGCALEKVGSGGLR